LPRLRMHFALTARSHPIFAAANTLAKNNPTKKNK